MQRRPPRAASRSLAAVALAVAAALPAAAAGDSRSQPPARGSPPRGPGELREAGRGGAPATDRAAKPRAFLIYLKDGGEPIVVPEYVEEGGQVRFEKYGGSVGIPTYEILRIVPDEPDSTPVFALPPPPPDEGPVLRAEQSDLYVSLRSGGNLRASSVEPQGEHVRVSVPDGSFTLPRSEIVGLVRVPDGPEAPEAWISIVKAGAAPEPPPSPSDPTTATAPASPPAPESRPEAPPAASPTPAAGSLPGGPRIPYPQSDRAHFVRLSTGQLMRLDGFWVEDGQLRFQRFGGMIGIALTEVLRLIPEEIAPVPGRTQVRFGRALGPDLIEVNVRSGVQRVRLLGITPVASAQADTSPWRELEQGTIVHLEFDRQRYDVEGNWLAYVFLPNHRMLNAELIRLGLARPHADGRNVRYLDLFHELATGDLPDGAGTITRPN